MSRSKVSRIPRKHVLRDNEPTAKSVLHDLAVEVHSWMRIEVEDYLTACENFDATRADRIPERSLVLRDVYEQIRDMWRTLDLSGEPQPKRFYASFRTHLWEVVAEREKKQME